MASRSLAFLSTIVGALALLSCSTTPPRMYPAPASTTLDYLPFERVWSATIAVCADAGLPIDAMEKESGFISSGLFRTTTRQAIDWIDCGKDLLGESWSGGVPVDARVTMAIRDLGDAGTSIRANLFPQYSGQKGVPGCVSNGVFEQWIVQEIVARAKEG